MTAGPASRPPPRRQWPPRHRRSWRIGRAPAPAGGGRHPVAASTSRNGYVKKGPSARLGAMRTLRILVVDDQEHMRELLVEALSADGHRVEPAENGMAAVTMFDAQPYDLVVSDLQMPQMDGPKLYGELQKRRPQGMPGFV